MKIRLIPLSLVGLTALASAKEAPDLIIPAEGTKTLPAGMYEYRTMTINPRGKLVLQDGVLIACESLSAGDGACIEYKATKRAPTQANISIDTLDASGLHFLYIAANGEDGKSQTGQARIGNPGRNASPPGHSIRYPGGRSADSGSPGTNGANGENGTPAANVRMHLPKLKPGSLIRIHANGGNGGNGQTGGNGGRGGNGAAMHPAARGSPGGRGGRGGNGGDAGKIVVYLVMADTATQPEKEEQLRTVHIETANSGGNAGTPGAGGGGGPGGHGAPLGGDGSSGGEGSRGQGADNATTGLDSRSSPIDRWNVIDVTTESEYMKEYDRTLQKIRSTLKR